MVVVNFLGTDIYIKMRPAFGVGPQLCKVPYTAKRPTIPQKRARAELGLTAHDLIGTFGVGTYKGKLMPLIAIEVAKEVKTGTGVHGGLTYHERLKHYQEMRKPGLAILEEWAKLPVVKPVVKK